MVTTIISIILSAIIAFFIAKWQMKKNKIVHFSINSYDIGKGLSNEFPEFQLHYDGENLSNNVMVLKGGFMNVGRNDIDALKGDADIKLILPEECRIKAVKVLPSTDDLIVNANQDKENVINFGIRELFKSNEYFKYTAIIETSIEIEDIFDNLKFQHRILNTEKIQDTYIGLQRKYRKYRRVKMVLLFSVLFFCLLIPYTTLIQRLQFKVYKNDTNTEVRVYVGPQSQLYVTDNKLQIPFISGNLVTKKELEDNYKIYPITSFSWSSGKTVFSVIAFIIVMIYSIFIYYLFWGKNRHILNVINKNEK